MDNITLETMTKIDQEDAFVWNELMGHPYDSKNIAFKIASCDCRDL